MNIIRVGNRFVNFDQATEVHCSALESDARVYFAATETGFVDGTVTLHEAHFTGGEAAALIWWLQHNSTDVLARFRDWRSKQ